jgi:hypothetical protein
MAIPSWSAMRHKAMPFAVVVQVRFSVNHGKTATYRSPKFGGKWKIALSSGDE